jgi:hypothetical protein
MPCLLRHLALAALLLATLPAPARAESATLDYQLVVHATEVHSVAAPGHPDRTVGTASFRGIAIFADGRLAHHSYAGGFDFVKGAGSFQGYASWLFEDGSRLDSRYRGEAAAAPGGGITFEGSHSEITGSGAYAGASGSGRFEGRRIDDLAGGGDTWQRGRLELELPGG